jgi:TFIIF-interacting CTD phosphatase-like protein
MYIQPVMEPSLIRVVFRRHLDQFLNSAIKKGYKLIVWSAGSETYVKDIANIIFRDRPLAYTFTPRHLTGNVKALSIITEYISDFKVENARLIDDNTIHRAGQERSFIQISRFEYNGPQSDDDELLNLIDRVDKSYI